MPAPKNTNNLIYTNTVESHRNSAGKDLMEVLTPQLHLREGNAPDSQDKA
tara:strand:+ start:173 stop:322 length:150 start_codon:yes stop_codon:yes gene_type:complete